MPGIVLGTLLVALAYAAAALPQGVRASPWLMVAGIAALLIGLCVRGIHRRGRRQPWLLTLGFVFLAVVLLGGFAAALLLPPESPATPLWLGLPRRAALVVYGVGVMPALVLPLLYGVCFERAVLSEAELAEFRRRLNELPPPSSE